MTSPLLPARIQPRPTRDSADRRALTRAPAWELVVVGVLGDGRFLATHALTGRSYRMEVGSVAEAEAEVAALNDATLEISA